MFDLSLPKLLILAVIGLVVLGPDKLPAMARQAGKMLRDLRRIADSAKNDLREGLGPEFQDFEFEDLNPKRFVQRHLLDDLNASFHAPSADVRAAAGGTSASPPMTAVAELAPGELPPYDAEAT